MIKIQDALEKAPSDKQKQFLISSACQKGLFFNIFNEYFLLI